jgi:hypothetical protein
VSAPGPVVVTPGRVDLDAPGATHNAFPGAARFPNGILVMCWRGAPSHVGGTGGVVYAARSADKGRTWTHMGMIHSVPGLDVRDPSFTVSADGSSLWLSYFTYETPASPNLAAWLVRSTDGGSTWDLPRRITPAEAAIAAPVVQTQAGTLLAPLYGPVNGLDSVRVARSTDLGETWHISMIAAHGQLDGRDYQEPWITDTPSGLVMLFRWGNTEAIARSVSTDDGLTWSTPTRLFDGSGRPSAARTSTGALVCVYRELGTRNAVVRSSRDDGVTWGPARLFDADTVQMAYAAPVEVEPGVLAVPNALERGSVSGSVSTLHVRYVIDGAGVSPLGDVGVTREQAVTVPRRTVLAFDDFDRPDGDLVSAPTGATWTATGSPVVRDGVLRTSGAGVALAYVTLGHGDHDVEADVQWVGNTGPGVLVRGVNANTYLLAALEGAGATVRLYKFESGVVTQLASAAEVTRSGQWVTLRVSVFGDLVRVFMDGHRVLSHTLSVGDAATFAPGTARRSGLRFNAPSAANVSAARRFVVSV